MSIGMQNHKCAVLPDGSRVAAIPLDATLSMIPPFDLTEAVNAFHIKVLPVPPKPCKKKNPPSLDETTFMISSILAFVHQSSSSAIFVILHSLFACRSLVLEELGGSRCQ
ncbi:hypothetical protein K1719_035046 [Acacia pycnantha]|nr:hypothetical protein K1719_035046 [Acacia pycnantha]